MTKGEGLNRRTVRAIQASERHAEREYYDLLIAQGRNEDANRVFPEGRP
jgi:hypothetical protein